MIQKWFYQTDFPTRFIIMIVRHIKSQSLIKIRRVLFIAPYFCMVMVRVSIFLFWENPPPWNRSNNYSSTLQVARLMDKCLLQRFTHLPTTCYDGAICVADGIFQNTSSSRCFRVACFEKEHKRNVTSNFVWRSGKARPFPIHALLYRDFTF